MEEPRMWRAMKAEAALSCLGLSFGVFCRICNSLVVELPVDSGRSSQRLQ